MSLAGREIAVVGGGIGGLAAATALARRGARVVVFEQAAALAEVGAGLQISPNGVAVLEALGLGEAAAARASLPEAVELRDHRAGRLVARVPLGAAARARHGGPTGSSTAPTCWRCWRRAPAAAGVEIRLGRRIVAVEALDRGSASSPMTAAGTTRRSPSRRTACARACARLPASPPRRRASPGTWPGAGWCRRSGCRRRRRRRSPG